MFFFIETMCPIPVSSKQQTDFVLPAVVDDFKGRRPGDERADTKGEKNRELVVSQGWRHFVTLWGNTLDSGHQHENKLSFTHLHSAGNRADSHVAKLDATGQEKQCSWDTLLIISSSLGSTQWSHFLSPPLLFVFVIVWCEWGHIHPGDGGQPTYILACWRLMTGNRNSPEKHADDLTTSTNTLAKSRSTRLALFSAHYRLPLKNLERFANAPRCITSSVLWTCLVQLRPICGSLLPAELILLSLCCSHEVCEARNVIIRQHFNEHANIARTSCTLWCLAVFAS